jgi:hypothetical protein
MRLEARLPIGLLLGALLVGLNATNQFPYVVRFNHSLFNNGCVALAALSVPVAVALLVKTAARRLLRWTALVGAAALLIPALLLALLLAIDLGSQDSLQDELTVGTAVFRVYMREPALITSPPFTVLRREIDTPVGLKLVRQIWADERYGNARLRRLDSTSIEVAIDGDWFRKKIEL